MDNSQKQYFWQRDWFIAANSVLLFFLLNGVFANNSCQLDLSRNQINSLSASTKNVFDRLDAPVLIEAYISTNVPGELHRGFRPILTNLQAIARLNHENIIIRIIDPKDENEQAQAQKRGLQGIPIEEQKELSASVRLGYYGVYVQQGEHNSLINLIANNWFIDDFEYRLLREIKRFYSKETSSGIAIAKGAGLSDIRSWNNPVDQNKDNVYGFKVSLEQDLGTVEEIELNQPIATDLKTLFLIGNPEFTDIQNYYLDQFLVNGGNVIALLRAFEFDIQFLNPELARYGIGGEESIGTATIDNDKLTRLNNWLEPYGIRIRGEVLLEPELAMSVIDIFNNFPRQISYPPWAIYSINAGNIVDDRFGAQLMLPWFSGLSFVDNKQNDVDFKPLVVSSKGVVSRDQQSLAYADVFNLSNKIGVEKLGKQLPLIVLASGSYQSVYTRDTLPPKANARLFVQKTPASEQSNLIVVSTPYFVSDILLKNQNSIRAFQINYAYILNILETLSGDTDLLAARSKRAVISQIPQLQPWIEKSISWFFVLVFPLILAIFGTIRINKRTRFVDKR